MLSLNWVSDVLIISVPDVFFSFLLINWKENDDDDDDDDDDDGDDDNDDDDDVFGVNSVLFNELYT